MNSLPTYILVVSQACQTMDTKVHKQTKKFVWNSLFQYLVGLSSPVAILRSFFCLTSGFDNEWVSGFIFPKQKLSEKICEQSWHLDLRLFCCAATPERSKSRRSGCLSRACCQRTLPPLAWTSHGWETPSPRNLTVEVRACVCLWFVGSVGGCQNGLGIAWLDTPRPSLPTNLSVEVCVGSVGGCKDGLGIAWLGSPLYPQTLLCGKVFLFGECKNGLGHHTGLDINNLAPPLLKHVQPCQWRKKRGWRRGEGFDISLGCLGGREGGCCTW